MVKKLYDYGKRQGPCFKGKRAFKILNGRMEKYYKGENEESVLKKNDKDYENGQSNQIWKPKWKFSSSNYKMISVWI